MTEEIKEILDKLKYIVDFSIIEHDTSFNSDNVEENVCLLTSNECQLLLDYITNLQQENEKLKYNARGQVNDYFKDKYTDEVLKNAKLKIENEMLKEYIKMYKCDYSPLYKELNGSDEK